MSFVSDKSFGSSKVIEEFQAATMPNILMDSRARINGCRGLPDQFSRFQPQRMFPLSTLKP